MVINANNKKIAVQGIVSETMQQGGNKYPALRIVFDGGVTAEELDALCSGRLEILDENGNTLGVQEGYTTRGEHALLVGKITGPEQERDELAAALAVEEAKKPYIETLTAGLDDATASTVIPLYGGMEYTGDLIKAGTRINWDGTLKRAAVDLWDRPENNPDNAPNLWTDVDYIDGVRKIPATDSGIFDASLAFSAGEEGYSTADGLVYVSQVNGNVYTPQLVPTNWKAKEVHVYE